MKLTAQQIRPILFGEVDRTEACRGKKVYGISPIRRYGTWEKAMGTFDGCIAVLREEYGARGIPRTDGRTPVPQDNPFYSGTLHPNALGFSCDSQNLVSMRFLTTRGDHP